MNILRLAVLLPLALAGCNWIGDLVNPKHVDLVPNPPTEAPRK